MDDEIIGIMARAVGFGSHGIVGERNARSALQALRDAGYMVVTAPPVAATPEAIDG